MERFQPANGTSATRVPQRRRACSRGSLPRVGSDSARAEISRPAVALNLGRPWAPAQGKPAGALARKGSQRPTAHTTQAKGPSPDGTTKVARLKGWTVRRINAPRDFSQAVKHAAKSLAKR